MTHSMREALAQAAEEQAQIIRNVIRDRAPEGKGAAETPGGAAFFVIAQVLEARALVLRGTEPVDVPHPDEPGSMVRVFADGSIEVLT